MMSMATESHVPALNALIPMAHVSSVSRSIAFYERLGFRVINAVTHSTETEPSFARLESGGASLLVVRGIPVDPAQQGIILTLYCEDVVAFHAAVKDAGVAVENVTYPPERPLGRFRISDPDGYDLAVTHT